MSENLKTKKPHKKSSWIQTILKNPKVLLTDEALLLRACKEFSSNTDFTSALFSLFEAHRRESDLLKWASENEVNNCQSAHDLFRGDSIASKLLFVVFFGELSRRYLNHLLIPLVNSIIHNKRKSLEVDPLKVGNDSASNLEWILAQCKEMIGRLRDSSDMCPLVLRDALLNAQQLIDKKFGNNTEDVVAVIIFLRCIGPSVALPEKYGLISSTEAAKIKQGSERGLVITSKLLQNVANGVEIESHKPHADIMNKFITENRPAIREYTAELTDPKVINMAKKMMAASIKDNTPEMIQEAEDNFKMCFENCLEGLSERNSVSEDDDNASTCSTNSTDDHRKNSSSVPGSPRISSPVLVDTQSYDATKLDEEKWKFLAELEKRTDWKMECESKSMGIVVSSCKVAGSNVLAMKLETTVNIEYDKLVEINKSTFTSEMDKRVSRVEKIDQIGAISHWIMETIPIFPIAARYFVTAHSERQLSADKSVVVEYAVPLPVKPKNKSAIRAEFMIFGKIVERVYDVVDDHDDNDSKSKKKEKKAKKEKKSSKKENLLKSTDRRDSVSSQNSTGTADSPIMVANPSKCRWTQYILCDLKGKIPLWVMNRSQKDQLNLLRQTKTMLEKQRDLPAIAICKNLSSSQQQQHLSANSSFSSANSSPILTRGSSSSSLNSQDSSH